MESSTPLMQQYHAIKAQYADALVFFQVGDFYELFFDDAKRAASFLGITLTKRGKINGEPIPLCGVPVHALDHYLSRLIKGGFKVAICDQLEEAKPGTVVKRGITRVLTPGTLTDAPLLDEKNSSYLMSFFPLEDSYGLLFGELLTAQLFATVIPAKADHQLESELTRFFPAEIILPQTAQAKDFTAKFKRMGYTVSPLDYEQNRTQEKEQLDRWMGQQFNPHTIQLFEKNQALAAALFYFYAYMRRNYESALYAFKTVQWYQPEDFLLLDRMTIHNLELVANTQDGGRHHTLLGLLDCASTPMGSRMIKKWILRPLLHKDAIGQRHDVVSVLIEEIALRKKLIALLSGMGDLERVIGRVLLDRATVQDYHMLGQALQWITTIKKLLATYNRIILMALINSNLDDFTAVVALLSNALNTDTHKNWTIKEGYDPSLDHLRNLIENGHKEIAHLELREQQRTGIGSLKIRYNGVHGYYIEVTKTHMDLIPADYKRTQTLVGRERFTTPELQQLHYDIERAEVEVQHIEQALFATIKQEVRTYAVSLRKAAHALSTLDALLGLAIVAGNNRYVRPRINNERIISIVGGRHPVIERECNGRFIPNATQLDDQQSLWIITGPNMGGKSTYLRQVALNCLLTHIGSFVAAEDANIALLDRIFTRIGAGDNLAGGKSTFLVEMEEAALICTQATAASLIILDEIGRGTSTFDGLAIAQSMVEYVVQNIGSRCLFATHYHELTALAETFSAVANYYAASTRSAEGIVFLYTIVPGVADGSFGIAVAQLAGLPKQVIDRARMLVQQFTAAGDHQHTKSTPLLAPIAPAEGDMITPARGMREVCSALAQIDCDQLSPKKAFDLIWDLKNMLEKSQKSDEK